jgi:hypothetical protein
VRIEDGTYRFLLPEAGTTGGDGEAKVEDGVVVFATITIEDSSIPGGPAVQSWTLSDFGSPIEIAAPPDDLVDEPVEGGPLVSLSPAPPQSCSSG